MPPRVQVPSVVPSAMWPLLASLYGQFEATSPPWKVRPRLRICVPTRVQAYKAKNNTPTAPDPVCWTSGRSRSRTMPMWPSASCTRYLPPRFMTINQAVEQLLSAPRPSTAGRLRSDARALPWLD